jgi:D-xylose transport system permease protein
VSTAAPPEVSAAAADQGGLAAIARSRWEAFKGGDVGSTPVLVGIVAITIFFTVKTNIFFTAVNFSNLIGQMAGVTVIAVGIVFVLLIGEIDLSVGYVSGIASVAVAEFQVAGSSHDYPGLVAMGLAVLIGAAIGAAQGSIIAFLGVPSFVVTLAGLLIAQGMIINLLGTQGVIGIQDHQIIDVANYVLTKNTGWIVATVFTVALAVASFGAYFSRLRSCCSRISPAARPSAGTSTPSAAAPKRPVARASTSR